MQRDVTGGALSAGEVAGLMDRRTKVLEHTRLAMAVSGGPDSMALAFTIKKWCEHKLLPPPLALIVDHALRNESAAEAAAVWQHLQTLGIDAEILRWEHVPVTARLHSEARKARYSLLLDTCRRHKIQVLLFAHQREDQAETILMRFAKGTGLDGLAGIPPEHVMQGVRIMRPFLTVPKERLIATCHDASIPFVTDPSNGLEKFARGRLRRVMPMLAEEGLTVERLIDFGTRAAETREALDHFTYDLLRASSRQDAFGTISINLPALLSAPRALTLRALSLALQTVHNEEHAPPHASLSLLLDALNDRDTMPPRTLHGCLVSCRKEDVIIAREFSAITETATIRGHGTVIWDGRWRVIIENSRTVPTDMYKIKALGNPPHDVLDRLAPSLRHKVPQGRVRAALPTLWSGTEIMAIPFFGNPMAKAELLTLWPPSGQ